MMRFHFSRFFLRGPSLAASILLAGCSLAPEYQRPDAPMASEWPNVLGVRYQGAGQGAVRGASPLETRDARPVTEVGWRSMFRDPQLQELITLALSENRNLRIAVARIEEARALYGIQRGELFPSIGAGAQASRQHSARGFRAPGASSISSQYQTGLALTRFELDLFGRLRNLSEAAREQYLATEEARRSVQISLVGQVAQAYFALRAARIQLDLTERTQAARQVSYDLVRQRVEGGVAGERDLHQAAALLEQAAADLAGFARAEAQARHALARLVGAPLPEALLAEPWAVAVGEAAGGKAGARDAVAFTRAAQVAHIAADLPASLLERRPDILAAEAQLRAANANIGAARAAFFPSISLTGMLGLASPALGQLFSAGSGQWSFAPSLAAPLFAGGSLRASLDLAKTREHIAVASYENAIQHAFREVADALAGEATFDAQIDALRERERATARVLELSTLRYENGIDSYLQVQTAQVDYFNAQQALVQAGLAALSNRVELYKALGGGWVQ